MNHFLEQLTLHPGMAIAAGAILLESLTLVGIRRAEGTTLLFKILGLALLAWSLGLAASIRAVVNTFHAIALSGSGGYGTVAAGLGESEGALLLGLLSALLTLAAGLLFARGAAAGNPGTAAPRRDPKPMSRWLPVSLTLLSALVAFLSLHTLWFVRLIVSIVLTRPTGNPPAAASVAATSQSVASHIMGLSVLSHVAILGSAGLVLALFLSGTRTFSPRQSRWGQTLAALLLVLCLIVTVVVWRQFAGFYETAMTGMPPS